MIFFTMAKKHNSAAINLKLKRRKMIKVKSKLHLLRHISKRNCALLPYLDDESLHTLGEFIYNIIHRKVKLDALQEKKVKAIHLIYQSKMKKDFKRLFLKKIKKN